jgi:hypothetical protein
MQLLVGGDATSTQGQAIFSGPAGAAGVSKVGEGTLGPLSLPGHEPCLPLFRL